MAGATKTPAKKPASKRPAPKPTVLATAPDVLDTSKLTPAQALFAHEYLRDLNATQAYLRTHPGVTSRTASVEGVRLLKHPAVASEIGRVRKELQSTIGFDVGTMLRREAEIAFADPRELVEHVVECCRHCHGVDHRYQHTEAEMEQRKRAHALALADASSARRKVLGDFDPQGGIGWDPRRAPHPECPECHGRGVGRTIVHDTRHLSPAARALYAGIKQTKSGIEVLMQDQAVARERIERHLGAFEKDNRQRSELAEQLAGFVAGLHQSGAGRLQTKPRGPK